MLNVDVMVGTQLLVEMLDDAGSAIAGRGLTDCEPVAGNHLAIAVGWRTTANTPTSGSLRFVFRGEVHLYTYWIEPP